jgi:hypothetical protein
LPIEVQRLADKQYENSGKIRFILHST